MSLATAEYVVVGGGPTGSTFATLMARKGHDVLIVDKDPDPNPLVGESLLPFGNRVLEKLGISTDGFLRKDGAVFTRNGSGVRFAFADAVRTPWDHAHQVPRGEFDRRFRAVARQAGVRFLTARVTGFDLPGTLHTDRGDIRARWIADAAGRGQLLARKLGIRGLHPVLRNAALSAHFRGVRQFSPARAGDITICEFDGGWFWFIPFAGGHTSVGVVMTPTCGLSGDRWAGALERCPDARQRLAAATALTPIAGVQDFTAYADRFHGDGWLLLGDAAMFLDPVFSSGVLFGLEAADSAVDALADDALDEWEARLRAAATTFETAILSWYTGAFLDVAFVPEELRVERYRKGITSLLAGDAFAPGNPAVARIARQLETLARVVERRQRRARTR